MRSTRSNSNANSTIVTTTGTGIDRTTSLEALSLLELPHLQGMTNLAALGLGPAMPPLSSALAGSTPLKVGVWGGGDGLDCGDWVCLVVV